MNATEQEIVREVIDGLRDMSEDAPDIFPQLAGYAITLHGLIEPLPEDEPAERWTRLPADTCDQAYAALSLFASVARALAVGEFSPEAFNWSALMRSAAAARDALEAARG